MIKFSVVVPLYNKEKYVGDCIQSIINQSFPPDEIIIVDDGSTDESLMIVERTIEKYTRKVNIIKKNNSGVSDSRNIGIKNASNEFIALIDADDLWDRDHLFLLHRLIMKSPDGVIYSSAFRSFGDHTPIKNLRRLTANSHETGMEIVEGYLTVTNRNKFGINSSSVCLRRTAVTELNGFTNISSGEDIEMWVRLSLNGKSYMHSLITSFYRLGVRGSLTQLTQKFIPSAEGYLPTASMLYLDTYVKQANGKIDDLQKINDARLYLKYRLTTGVKFYVGKMKLISAVLYMRTDIYRDYGPSVSELFVELIRVFLRRIVSSQ